MKHWSTDARVSRDSRYSWLIRFIARILGA